MTFAAPRRMSVDRGGKYSTIRWTENGVREYIRIGGFFLPNHHDFESDAVAKLALRLSKSA